MLVSRMCRHHSYFRVHVGENRATPTFFYISLKCHSSSVLVMFPNLNEHFWLDSHVMKLVIQVNS